MELWHRNRKARRTNLSMRIDRVRAHETDALPKGVTRWECCIHSWMRMIIIVHERELDDFHF